MAISWSGEIDQRVATERIVTVFQFVASRVVQNQHGIEPGIDAIGRAIENQPLPRLGVELEIVDVGIRFDPTVDDGAQRNLGCLIGSIVRLNLEQFRPRADDESPWI